MAENRPQPKPIGFFTCPICGEEHQTIKIDKGYKLYCYCEGGCTVKFGSKLSRKGIAELNQGKTTKLGNILIMPLGFKSQERKEDEQRGNAGRNIIDRRADGGNSGTGARNISSGVANWFFGDDDDE